MKDHRDVVTLKDIRRRKFVIYGLFLKKEPTAEMLDLDEAREGGKLQDFVCDNLKDEFSYATGLSIIEAVDAIVVSQIDNGGERICLDIDKKPETRRPSKCKRP